MNKKTIVTTSSTNAANAGKAEKTGPLAFGAKVAGNINAANSATTVVDAQNVSSDQAASFGQTKGLVSGVASELAPSIASGQTPKQSPSQNPGQNPGQNQPPPLASPHASPLKWSLLKLWGRFIFFARRHPLLILAICLLGVITLASLFAGVLAPFSPKAQNLYATNQAPSALHWMGTDSLGRDVFSRLLYAGRVSLWVGFVAVGISITIGLALGLVAGYFGGIVDELIMRLTDIMLCFPSFFLILAVIAFLEPSLVNIMVIIGLTSWMGVARLVRAETLTLRERDYVAASRLAGGGAGRILFLHILPNALGPVIVSATLGVGGAILIESSLSFLGLGVQPPVASWGNMLMEGKESLDLAPWLSIFPGLAILFTVLGYNLLGESLRDILDPRLK